jgi:hypothetical protein
MQNQGKLQYYAYMENQFSAVNSLTFALWFLLRRHNKKKTNSNSYLYEYFDQNSRLHWHENYWRSKSLPPFLEIQQRNFINTHTDI